MRVRQGGVVGDIKGGASRRGALHAGRGRGIPVHSLSCITGPENRMPPRGARLPPGCILDGSTIYNYYANCH